MTESTIRLCFFIGILLVMAIWEVVRPQRVRIAKRTQRWIVNLGLSFLSTISLSVLFPVLAVGMAKVVSEWSLGLFNNFYLHPIFSIALSVVALDCVIYFQHRFFHHIPVLWRLHKVHHTDRDLDVTSGIRFHPIEIWVSIIIKMVAIVIIGPPVEAVIIFEIILNGMALFNHGNVRIPEHVDGLLRLFVVTPDMHRVHHSVIRKETDSNFGFNLSCWDRLFCTYRAQPVEGHLGMTIGLNEYPDARRQNLLWVLILPFFKVPQHEEQDEHTIGSESES